MPDEVAYIIEIYHNGVVMRAPTETAERHVKEVAFLAELTGLKHPTDGTSRQTPDPNLDFYMLDDAQFKAYLEFRRELRESGMQERE